MKGHVKVVTLLFVCYFAFSPFVYEIHAETTLPRHYDLTTSVKLSRILDRQLMFSFVTSDCPHCQIFKEDVLSNPSVKEFINEHFVLSLISLDKPTTFTLPEKGEMSNYQLASGLGVRGTPSTFFFFPPDPGLSRREILGVSGVLECKYLNYYSDTAKELLKLIEYCEGDSEDEYESNIGIMMWSLDKIGKLSPEDVSKTADSTGGNDQFAFYHFRNQIKKISTEDFHFLENQSVGIPILSDSFDKALLENANEAILNFSDVGVAKEVAEQILNETSVNKVFVVKGPDGT